MDCFQSEQAFIMGMKPAVMTNDRYKMIHYLKDKYPFFTLQKRPNCNEYIFFQDKSKKEHFLDQMDKKPNPQNPEHIRALGLILGFPPKAVDYFVRLHFATSDKPILASQNVGLYYCGIHCASSVDSLLDDVLWLWDKYPYPEIDTLQIRYHRGSIEQLCKLDYENVKSLQFFQKLLKMTIELENQQLYTPALTTG
ncbi:hypothetical protein [Shimazuella kribbensis]|uniref:hypothetical protein n=1 Tax=Shimazuella kribbensis TaxID=139808 RepID=UPI0004296D85|nr:hypothetical protein [Shimazuella kribbensis]